MSTHTLIIHVEADETALPLDLPAIRESAARLIHEFYGIDGESLHGYGDANALVSRITVDGGEFDPASGTMSDEGTGAAMLTAEQIADNFAGIGHPFDWEDGPTRRAYLIHAVHMARGEVAR